MTAVRHQTSLEVLIQAQKTEVLEGSLIVEIWFLGHPNVLEWLIYFFRSDGPEAAETFLWGLRMV